MNNVIVSNVPKAGVYLTRKECNMIKTELITNTAYIKFLETQIEKLIKEQQDDVTGIGQC